VAKTAPMSLFFGMLAEYEWPVLRVSSVANQISVPPAGRTPSESPGPKLPNGRDGVGDHERTRFGGPHHHSGIPIAADRHCRRRAGAAA
jgi:hypothetical protein